MKTNVWNSSLNLTLNKCTNGLAKCVQEKFWQNDIYGRVYEWHFRHCRAWIWILGKVDYQNCRQVF
jgi:hypothetical protein